MYGITINLSQEEKLALSIMTGQHLERLIKPLKGESILVSKEILGSDVDVIEDKFKIYHSNQYYQSLSALHGDDLLYTETIFNRLVGMAKMHIHTDKITREVEEPSHGMAILSHQFGSFTLFDSPVETNSAVNFSLMQAYFAKSKVPGLGDEAENMNDGRRHLELYLSPEQYSRMVRADSTEVPCTIHHYQGQSNDAPPIGLKEQSKIRVNLKQDLALLLQPLHDQAATVIELINKHTLASKKAIARLREELDKFQSIYKGVEDKLCEFKLDAAQDTIEQYMKEIDREVSKEVMRLSEDKRNMIPTYRIGSL